jgi:ParB family chromosome partitioning protein
MIEVGGVTPSRFQPRRSFDETTLRQLADSIARAGVMQPIIVRPSKDASGGFELVAGERRWRAAQRAGLARVPAIVRDLTDEESAEWGLVENVQRDELNAIERGFALKEMAERFNLAHAELAQRVGLDRSSVANLIRLTELEPEIREMITSGKLSAGHGKALLMATPGALRLTLAKEAVMRSWSVRRLEMAARDKDVPPAAAPSRQEPTVRDAVVRDIERRVGQHLGTKVEVYSDRAGKRGRMVIEYYGLDHFEGILQRMNVPQE